jgi:glycine cleavage system H protein
MAEESYPAGLKYFKEHDWVRVEGDEAVFGITWYAQDALGEIVYVDLPDPGTVVHSGAKYGELESVKAVTDVYAPVGGEVMAKNEPLDDEPAAINDDPYGGGWLVRVKLTDPAELDELMTVEAYTTFLQEA